MSTDEKVFLWLVLAGIIALIIFRTRPNVFVPMDVEPEPQVDSVGFGPAPTEANRTTGPAYLMSASKYAFWPPLNNFLPTVTQGQIGQVVRRPLDFVTRWGQMQ